ncbi:atypical chemokine receptor 4-like [Synchiropus splendidus]|uniref:atypical chemokine receptor 4-like n=1 Tax=Synchiropus splendidus TaxID=270530 RepID=UPI00237E3223|nr:atypical chemokine receptor 4-like [Synchiropus splendidus]
MDDLYHDYNFSYEDHTHLCEKADVRAFAGLFLPTVYTLCLLVGIAGNALVVVVYGVHKRLRSMSDAFVTQLAAADLMLLFTLPFRAAAAARGWELGEVVCKTLSACYTINFACCMLLLACISLDRCRVVACEHGQLLWRTFSRRHCWKISTAVWATAFALGVPDLVLSKVIRSSNRSVCLPVYPVSGELEVFLESIEVLLGFLIPLLVMVLCYWKVGRALKEATGGDKNRKAFRILLIVVGVFVVTQLPYNILKFYRAMDSVYALVTHCESSKALDHATEVTESLALTHCCLNPLLYAVMGSSFWQHLLTVAKTLGRKRRRTETSEGDMNMSADSQGQSQETSTFSV